MYLIVAAGIPARRPGSESRWTSTLRMTHLRCVDHGDATPYSTVMVAPGENLTWLLSSTLDFHDQLPVPIPAAGNAAV